jgi:drug/metabolite transporter (DMT)-like permease
LGNRKKGIITGTVSMFFLSTYSILGKILLDTFSPETLVALTQTLSVLVLLLFFGFLPEAKKLKKLPSKDLFWLFIISILSAVIAPLLLLKGLKITTATSTIIISSLEPVLTGLIAFILLKESLSKHQIAGAILMFLGILVIATKGLNSSISFNQGDTLILIAALFWALSTNIFKKHLSHIRPDLIVLARNSIGAITIFLIIPFIFNIQHSIPSPLDKTVIIPLIIFSLFTIVIAQLLWYKALKQISATLASSLSLLRPFFALMLAALILKEDLYTYHLLGGLLATPGLILTIQHHQKHRHHHLIQKVKHQFK